MARFTLQADHMTDKQHKLDKFGSTLRRVREAAGLSRDELGRRVRLDASYIYRIETDARRPSREAALALAGALDVEGEDLDQWLMSLDYQPEPLLTVLSEAMRKRGSSRRAEVRTGDAWDLVRWADSLKSMGIQEERIGRLLRALESVKPVERSAVMRAVRATFTLLAEQLESPVRHAVIPAAGGHHRLIATHIMQRLLLRVIREAVDAGISEIVLILAPETAGSLYTPLAEALDLAIVPAINLSFREQSTAEGLGDAILRAEGFVENKPFAVLLPDDVVNEQTGRSLAPPILRQMIEAYGTLRNAHMLAVTPVSKNKMIRGGVVRVSPATITPNVFTILQLIEKPEFSHPICRDRHAFGIVGRYVTDARVFNCLRALSKNGCHPLQFTDSLEQLRQAGQNIYAFELAAPRQDIGGAIDHASELFGIASKKILTHRGRQNFAVERK